VITALVVAITIRFVVAVGAAVTVASMATAIIAPSCSSLVTDGTREGHGFWKVDGLLGAGG
jgi:hypothetical protein